MHPGPSGPTTTVFVYGLLKRGLELSHLLDGQEFLGTARTAPDFRLWSLEGGAFPGLTGPVGGPGPGGRSVTGELWSVTPLCLDLLDDAEGVAEGIYERRPVPLAAPHNAVTAEAYFYLGSLDGCPDAGDTWPPAGGG